MYLVVDGRFFYGAHEGRALDEVARIDPEFLRWVTDPQTCEMLALSEDEIADLSAALERVAREDAIPRIFDEPEWFRWSRVWIGAATETIDDAWATRYGEPFDRSLALAIYDDGFGCFAYLMPSNRVAMANPCGAEILELPPPAPPSPLPPILTPPPPAPPIPPLPPRAAEQPTLFDWAPAAPQFQFSSFKFDWTAEQLAALDEVEYWYRGRDDLFALTGPAGTGKSTLVKEIVRRYAIDEYDFEDGEGRTTCALAAMTGKAALRLSQCAARDTSTLHKILYWPPKPGEDMRFTRLREPPARLVVIDECSMMTPTVFADLQRWGVRAILVGDDYQLPPVITGEELKTHGEDYSVFSQVLGTRLQTVMRSSGGVLRAATRVRETGDICRESDLDGDGGYEYRMARKPIEAAVEEYLADRDDHLLITWRNEVRMSANGLIRSKLGHDGPLPDVGEPVLLKRNGQGFLNGEIVECAAFESGPIVGSIQTMWMTVRSGLRILVSVNGGRDGSFFDGGAPWVESWKRYHIDLQKQLLPEPIPVTWGYCLTAHSAQGSEARRATVFLCRGDERNEHFRKLTTLPSGDTVSMAARWVYTAVTRAKTRATMIVGR